ncbi:MAG: glycosyltransferase [Chloroflexota bacterium]
MKTIPLCTIGSTGDVNPYIGIGKELQRRGFRVVLITSQYFESQARNVGLEFIGLGSAEDYQRIIQNPDLWSPDLGFKVFAGSVILPILEPAYDAIASFDLAETVLVAQGQFFSAHIAHEKLGYLFITAHLHPAAFRSVHEFPLLPAWMPGLGKRGIFSLMDALVLDKVFAPGVNRFRQSLGLPPVKKIFDRWAHSPQLNSGLFPEWYAPPQPDWSPNTLLTGFVFYDQRGKSQSISPDVQSVLEEESAPIIFIPGMAMRHGEQFFADCIEACQRLGRRGILLTQHPEQLPASLPEGIRHFKYLPFSQVFPHVAALVHHGGIGTTAQAIAAGIPQVIRPMAHDQPDNAARVANLGIGATLDPKKFLILADFVVAFKTTYLVAKSRLLKVIFP